MRRFLYEIKFSSGYPRTRDDAHERASDDRDGNDPRRRGGALKPEKQREWAKQRKNLKS